MFSKRIINSGRFLKMPVSTQNLYFHLGMNADDDGIVEAYTIIKNCGASEDDLKILVAKGFCKVLNEDLVTYITNWTENNHVRADRKVDSIYKNLLLNMYPDELLIVSKKEKSTIYSGNEVEIIENTTSDNQVTTKCPHRLGKDRIGKDRIGKDREIKKKLTKDKSLVSKEKSPKVFFPEDERLDLAFKSYIEMRKKIKAPMTDRAVTLALNKLDKLASNDNEMKIAILDQSVLNCWKGLYVVHEDKPKKSELEEWANA